MALLGTADAFESISTCPRRGTAGNNLLPVGLLVGLLLLLLLVLLLWPLQL